MGLEEAIGAAEEDASDTCQYTKYNGENRTNCETRESEDTTVPREETTVPVLVEPDQWLLCGNYGHCGVLSEVMFQMKARKE